MLRLRPKPKPLRIKPRKMRRPKPRVCGRPLLRRRLQRQLRQPPLRRRQWLQSQRRRWQQLLSQLRRRQWPLRRLRSRRLFLPRLRRSPPRQRRFRPDLLLPQRFRRDPRRRALFHPDLRHPAPLRRGLLLRAKPLDREPRRPQPSAGPIHCRRGRRHRQLYRPRGHEFIRLPRVLRLAARRWRRGQVLQSIRVCGQAEDLRLRDPRCARALPPADRCRCGRDNALAAVEEGLERCFRRIESRRRPNRASRSTRESPRRARGRRLSGDLKRANANCIRCARAPVLASGAPRKWSALRRRRRASRVR